MKKLLSVFLAIVIISLTSIQVFASNLILSGEESYAPRIDNKQISLIENDYYKNYYNELFEHRYQKTQKLLSDNQDDNCDYSHLYSLLEKDSYTYITVVFNDKPDNVDYYEYNKEKLSLTFADEEILYVGNTTPMAVVKLDYDKISLLNKNENIIYIAEAFFSTGGIINFMTGSIEMGNIISNDGVTAADARFVLRFAAGLETVNVHSAKNLYFVADMNVDGRITSADARLILRTAAGLEKSKKISFPYAADWNDFA